MCIPAGLKNASLCIAAAAAHARTTLPTRRPTMHTAGRVGPDAHAGPLRRHGSNAISACAAALCAFRSCCNGAPMMVLEHERHFLVTSSSPPRHLLVTSSSVHRQQVLEVSLMILYNFGKTYNTYIIL